VQELPKGALLIVAGGDALGNPAALDEQDVEVTFQPPEAVSQIAEISLPDGTVCVTGVVQHEANAFVSVLGSKVHTAPFRMLPVTADAARLRAVHMPDHVPVAGELLEVIVQASDASNAVLDMEDMKVVAEMVLKSERGAGAGYLHCTHLAGSFFVSLTRPKTTQASSPKLRCTLLILFAAGHRESGHRELVTPLMSARIRSSENGLSMLPDDSVMGGVPNSPNASPGMRMNRVDSMQTDHSDAFRPTPSTMGGGAVPTPARNVPVTVERNGPGMFRLSATPESAGAYIMRAAVGSIGPDSAFLQVRSECTSP
jgi:hypothetical protein